MNVLISFLFVVFLAVNAHGMPLLPPEITSWMSLLQKETLSVQREGFYREYYDNGYMKSRLSFKNGQLDGRSFLFYPNGYLKQQVQYKEGVLDGTSFEFYENGQYKIQSNYKDGKTDGRTMMFYENGNLYCVMEYKDGELVEETILDDINLATAK